ncbi:MAG TPA: sulfatase [Bryobacteraceae bacterium]|nr:sulfatase [Bryobacteraceae bacterium]
MTASFRSALATLWLRLITVGVLAFFFAQALVLASGKAQGWSYYLTSLEVTFEIVVRLIAAALAGVIAGTALTVVIAPFLWFFAGSRTAAVDLLTRTAAFVALFLDSRFAIRTVITMYNLLAGWPVTVLFTAHFLAFAGVLCFRRTRRDVTANLDQFVGEKMTRRTAIATAVSTVALVATESALGRATGVVRAAAPAPARPKNNFLLITFDALAAEDMSLYGYGLPTTPNIDAFARGATVFTNYYSAATFTTACVATIMTGQRPSQTRIYHLQDKLSSAKSAKTLPRLLREAGYATGASVSNPIAYYLVDESINDFDSLPEPDYRRGLFKNTWDLTSPLHQRTGFGSRMEEFADLEYSWNNVLLEMDRWNPLAAYQPLCRPAASFKQAAEVLATLRDGFFMWVHVLAPHFPYISDPEDLGRFLPSGEMLTAEEYSFPGEYSPELQGRVDKSRLRYDELLRSTDRAFGAFMSGLEAAGRLRNTTVILSADHGESFTGGVVSHGNARQTRPEIHVPLVVRTPGQREGHRVALTADQTTLAPTILELAGLAKPDWMAGRSLAEWLSRNGGENEGIAFCEHFWTNSNFKPLHHGTVGVIDGKDQYVLDLASGKGALRPLQEAHMRDLDRQAEFPEKAKALREVLLARFPYLSSNTA